MVQDFTAKEIARFPDVNEGFREDKIGTNLELATFRMMGQETACIEKNVRGDGATLWSIDCGSERVIAGRFTGNGEGVR
jgi:hypothetical protein